MPDDTVSFHASFPVSLSAESETAIPIVPVGQHFTPQEVELMKFDIGLRLLDEKKRARFLAFMETLREREDGSTHGI